MNLRKLSHQSYLQAKQFPHKISKKVIQEKQVKDEPYKNNPNQETTVTVSDFDVSNNEKQLISDQRNKKRHFSPIFRSKNLIIETDATKKKLSLSREKIHSSNFSSLWDSNHSGNKQSIQYQQVNQDHQMTISKGSQQKLEYGIKHQKELDEFIKFKHQNTQTHSNEEKLKKFEKQKIKQKIKIEEEIDEEIDQSNNEKSCQFNLQKQSEEQKQPNSTGSSKPTHLLPIHLRYQYEQEYKQAKSKKVEIKEEINKQKKVVTQDKIEEFIKEQEKYLQKKAEFFTKEYEKKLWQLQQTENEFQFKPTLNEESCRILDKKQKGKKFQERQDQFQQNKQQKLDEQAQHAIPTFTPTISKKSKKMMENPAKPRLSTRNNYETNQVNRAKTSEDQ